MFRYCCPAAELTDIETGRPVVDSETGFPCTFYTDCPREASKHTQQCGAYRAKFDPEGMEAERRAKRRKNEAQAAAREEHMIKYQAAINNENKLILKMQRQTRKVEDLIKRLIPLVETWCREQRQGSDTESD